MTRYIVILVTYCFSVLFLFGQQSQKQGTRNYLNMRWGRVATQMPAEWYGSEDAKRVAENVLISQKNIGGWIKNQPYHHVFSESLKNKFLKDKSHPGATIDNGSTTSEMRFLAKVYAQVKDPVYRDAFIRGLDYLLQAQYKNGGWPQFYPKRGMGHSYSDHITYNDNAMTNVLRLLKDVYEKQDEYASLKINRRLRRKIKRAFDAGINCVLETQIIKDGKPTVWCAQHDSKTLEPAMGRSYELESFSGAESVGVVLLLMDIKKPSKEIVNSIESAVRWFEENKVEGIRLVNATDSLGRRNRVVVEDKDAPPIWGRFNDLETGKPFFCSRDGIKRDHLSEISPERRNNYSWYTYAPALLLKKYAEWSKERY